MSKKVKKFLNDAKMVLDRNSPIILTSIGVAGIFTTSVLAVRATPRAILLIEEAEKEKNEELTALETVKAAWKPYIPAVISGTVSTACIIGANSVNAKRNAALATAYKLSEEALSIYKDKVIETIGEKKEKTIQEKVAQEKINSDPVESKTVIVTGSGTTLCYDSITGRYFTSDMESIRKAVNNINERLVSQDYVALNEFYSELKIEHVSVGWNIGWNISTDGLVEVHYDSALTKDGRPCLVLNYEVEPKYDFNHIY